MSRDSNTEATEDLHQSESMQPNATQKLDKSSSSRASGSGSRRSRGTAVLKKTPPVAEWDSCTWENGRPVRRADTRQKRPPSYVKDHDSFRTIFAEGLREVSADIRESWEDMVDEVKQKKHTIV